MNMMTILRQFPTSVTTWHLFHPPLATGTDQRGQIGFCQANIWLRITLSCWARLATNWEKDRVQTKHQFCFYYRLDNSTPSYLSELVQKRTFSRVLRSPSDTNHFTISKIRTNISTWSFTNFSRYVELHTKSIWMQPNLKMFNNMSEDLSNLNMYINYKCH